MSAAQAMASQKSGATISQAEFDGLKTIDDLDAHLQARIRLR